MNFLVILPGAVTTTVKVEGAGKVYNNYASVGGAPEAYGSRCVVVYVFGACFSATAER